VQAAGHSRADVHARERVRPRSAITTTVQAGLIADEQLRTRLSANLSAFSPQAVRDPALRRAAVALVITPGEDRSARFVITRRAAGLRAHAGQWALPGGRLEPEEDATDAALRELHEEVGLSLQRTHALGRLDDYATRSGFAITPVVFFNEARASFRADPNEVAAVYEVPLGALGRPAAPRFSRIAESERPVIQLPIEELGTAIHAPTAAILFQLWEVAVQGRSTRVAHYEQPLFAWR
jgi:8-oxo-dGTP pyrophosphatase MutT (NUDIX family)